MPRIPDWSAVICEAFKSCHKTIFPYIDEDEAVCFSLYQDAFRLNIRLLALEDEYCAEFTLHDCYASLYVIDEVDIDSFSSWEVDEEKGEITYSYFTEDPPTLDQLNPIIDFFFAFANLVTISNSQLVAAIQDIVPNALKEE